MQEQKLSLNNLHIDKSWTVFLDRDGVINKKIDDDYVRNIGQFEWLADVREALQKLTAVFGRIIIVSNQQGVGKGLMQKEDVESIHNHIVESVKTYGGRIDNIYYAPQIKSENSEFRKPNIGMALQAKNDFPEIDFNKSMMVGDSITDIEFGKKAGMKTVFILNGKTNFSSKDIADFTFQNLSEFAETIFSAVPD